MLFSDRLGSCVLITSLFTFGLAHAKALTTEQRIACQFPTPNPLSGCPQNTLLVSSNANFSTAFKSVQSAVLSLPQDNSTRYILVLPGQYNEQINVTRSGPLYLLGQTSGPASLSGNTVEVTWHAATGGTNATDNAYTSTLTIAPTLNSSLTGSGPTGFPIPPDTPFGNTDFRAYNLNFTNDWLPYSAGPSLALSTSYANTGFYHCAFQSYQDTVYIGKLANAYMRDCEVAGQTDFLYGFGTLWIEKSALKMRGCGGGVTAWKGSNTSYTNHFGVYVRNSSVVAANETVKAGMRGRCALGRPWNSLHRSVFADSFLDESVAATGYIEWSAAEPRVDNSTLMAEYRTFGPGWNETGRVEGKVTRVLDERQWSAYSMPGKVFHFFKSGRTGNVGWVDWEA
ncbi:pectin lyase-like protein [Massarina eburnea CBS 473.64]|uniref:pectinesterase n=1 Tax=Massarina eburnea CBS 473.64 TaxID=1395130 RepID=A0A6A6SB21_9PLEO|nr:pectin lyase-like protein [Massarina eburnea CBS 473.64]